ncbi:MAG: hypothetical protein A4E66_02298 [Syntrophus sp. PtaB.Bin001]|nr:MAG: hypothetical protein A4E66_02298 [Syntrophus sp. PtaB.Bin001]
MDQFGEDFLADARFSLNQNRDLAAGNPPGQLQYLVHYRIVRDHPIGAQLVFKHLVDFRLQAVAHFPRLGELFLQGENLGHVSGVGDHPDDISFVIEHGSGGNQDLLPGADFLDAAHDFPALPCEAFNRCGKEMAVFI